MKTCRLSSGADRSGSTATTAFITPTHIIIGNCGDSRSVLISDGRVKFASEDHKPSNEKEQKRILVRSQGTCIIGLTRPQ